MASAPTYDPNLIEGYANAKIQATPAPLLAPGAASESRDAGPLPARLDLQDRHHRRGARIRQVHARVELLRPGLLRGLRQEGLQLRHHRARSGTSTSPPRSKTRSTPSSATSARSSARSARRLREALRLLLDPTARDALERTRATASTRGRKLFDPKEDTDVDPGRLAFGQERLLVTPLQMAMVAGAIANHGIVMKPTSSTESSRRTGRRRAHAAAGLGRPSSPRRPRRSAT